MMNRIINSSTIKLYEKWMKSQRIGVIPVLYQYSQFRILQYPLFSDNGYMFPFFFTKRVRISLSRQTAEEKN